MPWYHDLALKRLGAEYIEPELNVALLLKDGRSLQWWTNFESTIASFANFSRRDAETLREWRERFLPIVEKILIPESQSPPRPPLERRAMLEQTAEGRLLLETSLLSPLEFVVREFENPTIQAGLLFFNGLREVDLRSKGFGHHIPALLASSGKAQMCKGGSAMLANALVRAVEGHGGVIKLNTQPERILIEGEKAVGVKTTSGEVFSARHFVCSGLNPQQTFLSLIDLELVPKSWRTLARNYKYNLLAPLFGLYLNLHAAPRYKAAQTDPGLDKALMVILGLEHLDQFPDIVRHHERGTIPPTVMWGSCPTAFDPTQAPPGKHTAFMWEKLPYHLGGNPKNWDKEKDAHGRKMLETWKTYAPNLEVDTMSWFTRSPLDTERALPNMKYGDLLVGALSEGQTGYNRPFPGAGNYRGHVKGLYLCGSSSHPGGNITGLPGYNCAKVLLADLA